MALHRWRIAAWILGIYPLAYALFLAIGNRLGANAVETLQHLSGIWALRLLLLTLCASPLQRLIKRPEPVQIRRLLGLWSFFYASVHLLLYLVFDVGMRLTELQADLLDRRYMTAGLAALVLLLPLAATSTRAWQRRLGRRWKTLHRLIYPAAVLACIHFLWRTKADYAEPSFYALALAVLLIGRIR